MANYEQVIITGASGLLGSQLVEVFQNRGYKVLAVFNKKSELVSRGVKSIQCDISDKISVEALVREINLPSLIIHCAAITSVDLCEKNRELCSLVNIEGTRNIRELAKKTDSTIIFISTASVFNGIAGDYKEGDMTSPLNYYSLSKVEGEKLVLGYNKGIVIRMIPLGLHLAGREATSFLEWLVNSFKTNQDINLFTDVRINPLSVLTIGEIMVGITDFIENGIIHLGSRDVVSKADIGREVNKFFPQYSGKLNLISIDDDKKNLIARPKEMWLNVDKALSLGIKLPEALADINKYLHGKKLL